MHKIDEWLEEIRNEDVDLRWWKQYTQQAECGGGGGGGVETSLLFLAQILCPTQYEMKIGTM